MINILIVLFYCIGIFLLWIDPHCAENRLIFFVCSSIPISLIYFKNENKTIPNNNKIKVIDVILNGFVALLGVAAAYLILIDFYKEEPLFFISLVVLLIINIGVILIWNRRKGESD